ncbi:MAG: formimidoylglutamate deiminase [Gammaproteobacteria bacterium]|nr:formimidoylglutamate deiminase [Gammaproteobacteria bacterium]
MNPASLYCPSALLSDGWHDNVVLHFTVDGKIAATESGTPAQATMRATGPCVPGMPNLHSHAFQRAMAGLTERAGNTADNFWTWRETMYRLAAQVAPDDLSAIAMQLYIEMLKAGYTSVAEFHYLHHTADGTPYADPAEMSLRLMEAARAVGLRQTLLPTLYCHSDFGGKPPTERQRRFINPVERLLAIIERCRAHARGADTLAVGLGLHSLRAVTPDELQATLSGMTTIDATAPIHLHIAEQVAEVDSCIAWSGQRPVDWLFNAVPVDRRWCLVHAIHVDDREIARMAASGAVVGLCPTTEANLGDGLFPILPYLAAGGRYGIGSDSQISVAVHEELRWLEYSQRLQRRERNLLRLGEGSIGEGIYRAAQRGGAAALGQVGDGLAIGAAADLLVLDADHPKLIGRTRADQLTSYVFAGDSSCIRDVYVGGRPVIIDGRHSDEAVVFDRFRKSLTTLFARTF